MKQLTLIHMRALLDLTQTEFGMKYNIPMRTIQNWETGARACPRYVLSLLQRCVLEDYVAEHGPIPAYIVIGSQYMVADYDEYEVLETCDDIQTARDKAYQWQVKAYIVEIIPGLDYLTEEYLAEDYSPVK